MAFTDVTTGGRTILEGVGPVKITLGEAAKVGDILVYNSGWVEADGSTNAEATGLLLCAGESGASAAVITAYMKARLGGITTGTAGNPLYLSDTQGQYAATTGTYTRVVGYELGGSEIMFDPSPSLIADDLEIADGFSIHTATGNNKSLTIQVGSATAAGFTDVIKVQSATVIANAELGFFGVTPVAQQATITASTGGNTTVDKIIAVLDAFGFTATA